MSLVFGHQAINKKVNDVYLKFRARTRGPWASQASEGFARNSGAHAPQICLRAENLLHRRGKCPKVSLKSPKAPADLVEIFPIRVVPSPWDHHSQLRPAFSSNLPQELCEIIEYEAVVASGCFSFVVQLYFGINSDRNPSEITNTHKT